MFRSDFKVDLIGQYGSDLDIAKAAWVSSGKDDDTVSEKRINGVLRALMRDKHGSPFESGYFAFKIEAPRAVRDEMVRHRMLSFSCSSLRYTEDTGEYYIPPRERPIKKAEGFKQIQPRYEPLSDEEYDAYVGTLKNGYVHSESVMKQLRESGRTETEATRWITHDGTYCSWVARMNPRALMHFLALRTHEEEADFVSWPMWEIEQVARKMEAEFQKMLPITYEHWNQFGRKAP